MKIYAKLIKIVGTITLFSGALCFYLHYCFPQNEETSFWLNVLLSIFGGGLLTFITSITSYRIERTNVLVNFQVSVERILKVLLKYDINWDKKKKASFFIEFCNIDFYEVDFAYGEIFFLFDFSNKSREYIFYELYLPLRNLIETIYNYKVEFQRFLDSDKNSNSVLTPILTIEATLTKNIRYTFSNGESYNILDTTYFVGRYRKEFYYNYYSLIYGHLKKGKNNESS